MSKKNSKTVYNQISNIWKNYRWEFLFVLSVFVIIVCWFLKPDSVYNGIVIDTSILKGKREKTKGVYKNEEKCREIVESIYNLPFKKVRPNFLKNPKTGRNLELDMYNDQLKIAIEYNGIQHRTYAPYFHKSYDDYLGQVDRDNLKKQKCKENGVTLICVPDTVRYEELQSYIITELRREGKL